VPETIYADPPAAAVGLDHAYGDNVHIIADAWSLSLLARLGSPECKPPIVHDLVASAYARLLHAMVALLPRRTVSAATRMTAIEPRAHYDGVIVDPTHPVVVVDLARAGILPALVCQRALLEILDADAVRVDHIYVQRVADPRSGAVMGVDLSGSKIGGGVDGATIVIPDPMGATGSSIDRVIAHYRDQVPGKQARIVTCHLMVTPEYLRKITNEHPDVHVFALRLDRGLSPDDVLATRPGERWSEERGLTEKSYIVPGAGGMGEVINNAWV